MTSGTAQAIGEERLVAASGRDADRVGMSVSERGLLVRLSAIWHAQSVRAQLLITVLVIDAVAALVAGGVIVLKARTSTRVEIAASMTLAEALVREAVDAAPAAAPLDMLAASLPIQQRLLRHVRIAIADSEGHPVTPRTTSDDAVRPDRRAPAPTWFATLIAPPAERHDLPVAVDGKRVGAVTITGEPSDEIAEVWENTIALAAVAAVVNLAVIAILYVLFGRVLGPLTALSGGLRDLERRRYDVRLAAPGSRELAIITERFNALAHALDAARTENLALANRLITAQDDERRRTALELHDEVGPCLFGLKAYATSIAALGDRLPDGHAQDLRERADEMLTIVERLQLLNRSLLKRLRPMALGHVPLRDLLAEVVADRERQHPQIAFVFSAGALQPSYGDAIDLTIYRCVQESLSNAIRHANGTSVAVDLGEANGGDAAPSIRLVVRDDGAGIAPNASAGFGLAGMQERVRALGGHCVIDDAEVRGTSVHVTIPLPSMIPKSGHRVSEEDHAPIKSAGASA